MSTTNDKNSRRNFFRTSGTAAGLALLASAGTSNVAEGADATELNALLPTDEQGAEFAALGDQEVFMVNLLKFKDAAEYKMYTDKVAPLLEKIEAEILVSGQCKATVIGTADWDAFAVVKYPSASDLVGMIQSEEYQAITHHREAGLEGQVLIAVTEQEEPAEGITAKQIMEQMDANKDGKIDMDEAPDQLKQSFGLVDANGDGSIDLEEAQLIADFINNQ
jgi:uncharacterized protein (DUF1330 family)